MNLITIVIGVILIALAFYANNTWVTPGIIRSIINIVLMVVCIVVILSIFGLTGVGSLRV